MSVNNLYFPLGVELSCYILIFKTYFPMNGWGRGGNTFHDGLTMLQCLHYVSSSFIPGDMWFSADCILQFLTNQTLFWNKNLFHLLMFWPWMTSYLILVVQYILSFYWHCFIMPFSFLYFQPLCVNWISHLAHSNVSFVHDCNPLTFSRLTDMVSFLLSKFMFFIVY